MARDQFPDGFWWGVATAAYQIEGAVNEGGRGPSVWDRFSSVLGRVRTGESGARACDHYHRYRDDIRLMASLGIKHYRCSLSWPRILPEGTGVVNEEGLDFYRRLFDCCGEHGITPHVTLFHWDSPWALEERYGSWRSRRMAEDFAAYVTVAVRALGDRVTHWMTINEIPCFTLMGYGVGKPGEHAPGTQVESRREVWQTVVHACLAHGMAVRAIREHTPQPCRISLVDNMVSPVPVSESPENVKAAGKAFAEQGGNPFIIMPVLTGKIPERVVEEKIASGEMPEITVEDLDIISTPMDSLGLNIYSGVYVRAAETACGYEILEFPQGYPRLHMPWLNLVPDAIYWAARHVLEVGGFRGELFVSENGCAAQDQINERGEVMDLDRIVFIKSYLRQVHRCCQEGMPMRGYFLWSFLDNFEWAWGYSRRFGIVYTNYETMERLPKASAHWYAECIRQNRVA